MKLMTVDTDLFWYVLGPHDVDGNATVDGRLLVEGNSGNTLRSTNFETGKEEGA